MSAVLEEVDHDATMRECRTLRRDLFRADRDYAVAQLLALNRLADEAVQRLPEKFHAPFIAALTVAQDGLRHLRADKRPREYFIGDAADFIEIANSEAGGLA